MVYNSIRPGQVWLDTEGKRIQAHGGSLLYEDGYYYWYGENKEKTTGKDSIWHWGVRCYRSSDLYNWEDMGVIIEPNTEDKRSSLHPTACMDRPHIIYNQVTKKYVCWLKIMTIDGPQTETVLTADHLLGPYKIVREGIKPLGMSAGDFDLAVAPDDKAYYYFERVHSETICADLTDDYTDVTGYYSTHFPHPLPPYVREATAHFVRKGRHYIITSGTTGYYPNPSEVAVGDSWHGPYTVLGNPHVDDSSETSFHSQISSVFKVPGKKDLYIACADRWLPNRMDVLYKDCERACSLYADPDTATNAEKQKELKALAEKIPFRESLGIGVDTSVADYVWLPLKFTEPDKTHPQGQVLIEWKDKWCIEDYE